MESNEYAIYDGGDANSKANKMVRKIEIDPNLSEEEKMALLAAHEAQLSNIEQLMDADRMKQEQELDRALQERLARRKRNAERFNKKEIKEAQKEAQQEVDNHFEQKTNEVLENLENEH